jgi:toxin ParE1/3/4
MDGVARFGIAQAEAYQDRIEKVFGLLAENPGMARERRELDPPVRVHPCGAHVIVYGVGTDGGVLIIRVRHGREDWLDGPGDDPEG